MASQPADLREGSPGVTSSDTERLVLAYLVEHGEATETELIEWVARQRSDGPMTDHDRVRTAINLRLTHLPNLEDADYVRRDQGTLEADFLPADLYEAVASVL